MAGNPLKDRLAARQPVFGGWCSSGSPFAAEVIALQGFDFVGLDGQHGLWSYESLLSKHDGAGENWLRNHRSHALARRRSRWPDA